MIGDTIVVVEDEPNLRGVLRDLLSSEGYRILTAADPRMIDSVITGHDPALFLIDIELPGMSGIELAETLHSTGHTTTPMIAMSASQQMTRSAARSPWFTSVLEKPFELGDLVDRVDQHLLAR